MNVIRFIQNCAVPTYVNISSQKKSNEIIVDTFQSKNLYHPYIYVNRV